MRGDRSSTINLENRIQDLGRALLQAARADKGRRPGRFWTDHLVQWAMRDPAFKVQLFRFVDVFPMLRGADQIHAHLQEYLASPGASAPAGLALGLKAGSLFRKTVGDTVGSRILAMANRFILAPDAQTAMAPLRHLRSRGMAASVDLLGEACLSDAEALAYQRRYLSLIDSIAREQSNWPAVAALDSDHLGEIPRANVSIKISSLSARIKPADTEGSIAHLIESLSPILEMAGQSNILINFDMEQHALKDLTLELFQRCCERFDFPAGLALQAYLRSGESDADRLIQWARRAGKQVTVRLIKGAYWDYEVIHAEMMGWPCPVWSRKNETDACFERMAARFISQMPCEPGQPGVKLAVGTHNVRSIAANLAMAEQNGLPPAALEFQMLHGMADELKTALVERGLRVRVYTPVGDMIPGMAYLVRRLLENTSNASWLRAGFAEDASPQALLASPHPHDIETQARLREGYEDHSRPQRAEMPRQGLPDPSGAATSGGPPGSADRNGHPPFVNEPPRDFSQAPVRNRFRRAIARSSVPAVRADATVSQARQAVETAYEACRTWRDVPVGKRAAALRKTAAILRGRRDEVAGIVIRESGKTWAEADADVCEAIDFASFYADQAVGLAQPSRLGRFVGELNQQWHEPHGVAVIISPWNFPLSICAGMTMAALVMGNPAIVKPAEQTPAIARVLCEALWQAGVPREVLHFIPGAGETVGAALVRDTRVAIVAFTGSKDVGLDILAAAARTPSNQPHIKHVVCEMGGKNAILVDDSADLDEAVLAVRDSAFSYSGQKCSACSRAIVLDAIHDVFLRRLVESTRSLVIGDPMDPATDLGPVIDMQAAAKIREYIAIGMAEGRLEFKGTVPAGLEERLGKPVIAPHIFSDVHERNRLAQDEIFGPVLSVMRARDFDEALRIANSTPYRLTGGVFSRTPSHLERARREFRTGNLYLNRGITGALVGRQPFGGFGLSGGGAKAGGAEYLLHFAHPRVCTENTLRRGFAPDSETASTEG